ncbi:hypothetical protein ACHAW5_010418 [Stephanodiscus triporus]|uniref:Uncharacterized protein n=1 Tax=Stephanodiscus triporus TaxID=2934178 RepID=A0ABD3PCR7_9STRA
MISASPLAALLLATMASSVALLLPPSSAFVRSIAAVPPSLSRRTAHHGPLFMSTVLRPETQKKKKKNREGGGFEIPPPDGEGSLRGPVEWLIDDDLVSREIDDPFHILLLDATFANNDRITIEYVASSCAYVLSMPYDEAAELASHAESEGFSCLGTWGHGECVRLGRELTNRDLVCRVVPFCEGGDRAWQARDARDESGMRHAEG